jgi:hypothetical protein
MAALVKWDKNVVYSIFHKVMLESVFLSYNYSTMLILQSQPTIGLIIVTKKKIKKSKVNWDCYVSIVR